MKSPTTRYQGMTRKQYKRIKAQSCHEAGRNKTVLCQATPLEKAMARYPRSIKTSPREYFNINLKKDLLTHRQSFFTKNQ